MKNVSGITSMLPDSRKFAEAQNDPITLTCKNVSLLAAMDSIRQHSNYRLLL